jgi:glycosyltransferase involved in cell wall biosynthesis
VHHVLRLPEHRGLAAAFMAGIDASLRLGADVIVNTDADSQYRGEDIPRLIAPILERRADVVIGDRGTDTVRHFSPAKRVLQKWGSRVVRGASGVDVADATSGFRAFARDAACALFVHNDFTYTVETIIQGGRSGLSFANVGIQSAPPSRSSRLARSMGQYLLRSTPVIVRSHALYRSFETFMAIALVLLAAGAALCARFLYFYVTESERSGHAQSLSVGVGCIILALLVAIAALFSDLMAANRRLLEEVLRRVRRIELERSLPQARPARIDGVSSTGAAPWRRKAGDSR